MPLSVSHFSVLVMSVTIFGVDSTMISEMFFADLVCVLSDLINNYYKIHL